MKNISGDYTQGCGEGEGMCKLYCNNEQCKYQDAARQQCTAQEVYYVDRPNCKKGAGGRYKSTHERVIK